MAVNGPWLNGPSESKSSDINLRNDPYATYGKTSGILAPSPSMLWVLVDENADGLNDAAFAFTMVQSGPSGSVPQWIDDPGSYHNGACGFAFADGHSEFHKWQETPEKQSEADPSDWGWMQQRTSVRVNNPSGQ
jgi:prepilin-type processing-associated H-X9-DG protein